MVQRIKVHVKLKSLGPLAPNLPARSDSRTRADEKEMRETGDIRETGDMRGTGDMRELVNQCIKHKVVIRGNRAALQRALRCKVDGRSGRTLQETRRKVLYQMLLWRMGGGHRMKGAHIYNDTDFFTGTSIAQIPLAYIFCIPDSTGGLMVFDIRSLNGFLQERPWDQEPVHPYTMKPLSTEDRRRLKVKNTYLEKLSYHTTHCRSVVPVPLRTKAVSVFQLLSRYLYVDYEWFWSLSFRALLTLYEEMWELWVHRLMLTQEARRRVVRGGTIFDKWKETVCKYTPAMKDVLREEILHNLERLLTEGVSDEDRKSGAIYFMLGLVTVSPQAAACNPALYEAMGSGNEEAEEAGPAEAPVIFGEVYEVDES